MNKKKTILCCNQKGGVGKTLVCDEISFAFDREGVSYSLIDLDQQGGRVHPQIINEDADITILDTPGALQPKLLEWMKDADLIIIPTKMTPRDLQPFLTMIELIKRNNIQVPVFYVLNEWNRYRASTEFEQWFKSSFPDSLFYRIPKSEGFTQAALEGISILDHKEYKKSEAAAYIQVLIEAVEYVLGLKDIEVK